MDASLIQRMGKRMTPKTRFGQICSSVGAVLCLLLAGAVTWVAVGAAGVRILGGAGALTAPVVAGSAVAVAVCVWVAVWVRAVPVPAPRRWPVSVATAPVLVVASIAAVLFIVNPFKEQSNELNKIVVLPLETNSKDQDQINLAIGLNSIGSKSTVPAPSKSFTAVPTSNPYSSSSSLTKCPIPNVGNPK